MTPTLSEVRNWDTEHLTAAADHWSATATVWEDRFTEYATQVANPGGTPWDGTAAEAAQQRARSDRMAVIGLADLLHEASAIARAGALRIADARQRVLSGVVAAERADFSVGEDFSVRDRHAFSVRAAAVRHGQAVRFAEELRVNVAELVAADSELAATLTTATAGLGIDPFATSTAAQPDTSPGHAPFRRGEPIDPTDWRVGDQRFGYWEDVPIPLKPWVDDVPPPLGREIRRFPEDRLRDNAARPTEFFVPNKSWLFDSEAPYVQCQEQYMIRISGTEATPYVRVPTDAGRATQQRWVAYTYEVSKRRQVVLGGDIRVRGHVGDIAALGPFPWIEQTWTPTPINDIARLSADNPTIRFNIPDGCGGQFAYTAGVPAGGWIGKPSGPPVMARP